MTNSITETTQYLRQGIEAARSGRKKEARQLLMVVLKQSPNNIPALFWMAFVAPSRQVSLRLFERILELEPENERARAGIRWVKQQPQASKADVAASTQPAAASGQTDKTGEEQPESLTRDELLSRQKIQERAHKGAVAHRARRTINPFLAILLLVAAGAIIGTIIWAQAVLPSDTLAAWLPVSTDIAPVRIEAGVANLADEVAKLPAGTNLEMSKPDDEPPSSSARVSGNFVSYADVLPPQEILSVETALAETEKQPPANSPDILFGTEPIETVAAAEQAKMVSFNLLGPVGEAVNGLKLFESVDESLLVHQPASSDEKWIEVDVTQQQVTAWEGNVPVMAFLSSTGLPNTPTVLGEYNIYWKLESTLMAGPGYYLPDVPYTMYFYKGYALHGAYWHDNFGQPMSHGCVNLSDENSRTLFEWADPVIPPGQTQVTSSVNNPGTLVVVHQ